MNEMRKEVVCRWTYWALFIVAPTLAVVFFGSWKHPRIGWALPVFIVLVLIGEHAYRRWVKLWRFNDLETRAKDGRAEGPNQSS